MNGPINTIAQLELWRLEIRVLSTVGAALFMALWFVGYLVFGADASAWIFGVLFCGLGIVVAVLVCTVVVTALRGRPGGSAYDRGLADYHRAMGPDGPGSG